MHHAPPPPQRRVHHRTYFWRMTPQQRAAVRRIRYFAQVLWLRQLPGWMAPGLMVSKRTITIRHSYCTYWESGAPLSIQAFQWGWGEWVRWLPQLQELELEAKPRRGRGRSWRSRSESHLSGSFHLWMISRWFTMARSLWLGTSRFAPAVTGLPGGRLSGPGRLTWNSLSKDSNL
ncbi:hypothetical protein B0H19DRAFT_1149928 [Mycena capillaripes]|nr:hypothetical protein B0H19DRAFT_1149928 [Mycena capillaripes]